MTLAIFAVGIVVFLITVYGTVVTGGLLLSGDQLDDQQHLSPELLEREAAVVRERAKIGTES